MIISLPGRTTRPISASTTAGSARCSNTYSESTRSNESSAKGNRWPRPSIRLYAPCSDSVSQSTSRAVTCPEPLAEARSLIRWVSRQRQSEARDRTYSRRPGTDIIVTIHADGALQSLVEYFYPVVQRAECRY